VWRRLTWPAETAIDVGVSLKQLPENAQSFLSMTDIVAITGAEDHGAACAEGSREVVAEEELHGSLVGSLVIFVVVEFSHHASTCCQSLLCK